jgi:excisionase family DNA binding protein
VASEPYARDPLLTSLPQAAERACENPVRRRMRTQVQDPLPPRVDRASVLAAALLAEIDNETLGTLADRLAPILATRIGHAEQAFRWLDVEHAAEHLSCPRSRIYALVSARRIPHHKDGSRLLFRREELDDWVRAGGGRRP